MTVSFQTNTLKSRRKANIDGREYIVRQYGNIERMEVMRLNDEIKKVLDKYPENVDDDQITEADLKLIQEMAKKSSNSLVSLFDDGTETQEHARKLVASLTDEDIIEIIASVFEQTEPKEEIVETKDDTQS